MTSRLRNLSRALISISLLIGLLFYIDIDKIKSFTPNIISPPILIALALALLQIVLTSVRWKLLLAVVDVALPLRVVIRTNVVGIIANIILINVIGGLVARAGMLTPKGVQVHSVLSTSILERAIILVVLVIMSVAGMVHLGLEMAVHGNIIFRIIAGLMLVLSIGLLVLNYAEPIFGTRLAWLKTQVLSTWVEIRAQFGNLRAIVTASALTVVSQLLLVGVGLAVCYATDRSVSLLDCAMILPLVALISSLPISIGGLGLREVSAVVLLGTVGLSTEQALMISLLISIITLLAACLAFAVDMVCEFGVRAHERVSG